VPGLQIRLHSSETPLFRGHAHDVRVHFGEGVCKFDKVIVYSFNSFLVSEFD